MFYVNLRTFAISIFILKSNYIGNQHQRLGGWAGRGNGKTDMGHSNKLDNRPAWRNQIKETDM